MFPIFEKFLLQLIYFKYILFLNEQVILRHIYYHLLLLSTFYLHSGCDIGTYSSLDCWGLYTSFAHISHPKDQNVKFMTPIQP